MKAPTAIPTILSHYWYWGFQWKTLQYFILSVSPCPSRIPAVTQWQLRHYVKGQCSDIRTRERFDLMPHAEESLIDCRQTWTPSYLPLLSLSPSAWPSHAGFTVEAHLNLENCAQWVHHSKHQLKVKAQPLSWEGRNKKTRHLWSKGLHRHYFLIWTNGL